MRARYERLCGNLMNMVRYVVFHIEQSNGFRVLKMVIEFMTDINGQYYLKAVPKLY